MYISMCCNVLQLLNCNLLFRLAIVALLGYSEFNQNVTRVRIRVYSRIAITHAAGVW